MSDLNTEDKKFKVNKKEENTDPFPYNMRKWIPNIYIDLNSNNYIRVMSYNILCDSLVSVSTDIKESEFEKLSYVKWDARRKKIIEEISLINPDIICIQELEKDEEFIKFLGKLNYDCALKPRTGEHSEGCAIFWKYNKLSLENLFCLEFNMVNDKSKILKNDIYSRDNIAIFAILKLISNPKKAFIVCNTHILFNQNRGDIKLAQITQIMKMFNILNSAYCNCFSDGINQIICCDLNSVPNSACYKYITGDPIDCNQLDRRRISNQMQGNINSIDPTRVSQMLLKYVTSKYDEKKNKSHDYFSNVDWFNELLSVEPVYDTEKFEFKLVKNINYTGNTQNLILIPQCCFKSAYSSVLKNILELINFHKNCSFNLANEKTHKNILENNTTLKSLSEHIKDINLLDNINLYGIKIGIKEIEKTNSFVKHFTLEPPFTYYSKNCFGTFDYIFYSGKINPLRVLNIPDTRKIAMDIGELPNEIFPSDHISICVDFHILD